MHHISRVTSLYQRLKRKRHVGMRRLTYKERMKFIFTVGDRIVVYREGTDQERAVWWEEEHGKGS